MQKAPRCKLLLASRIPWTCSSFMGFTLRFQPKVLQIASKSTWHIDLKFTRSRDGKEGFNLVTGDSDRNLISSMITIKGNFLQIPNIHNLKTTALLYEGLNPHFSCRNSFLLHLNFRLHTGPFISEGEIAHGGSGIGRLLYVDDRGSLTIHSINMCDLAQKSLHGDLLTDATSLHYDLNMDDFRFLHPNVKGEGREDANRK